MRKFESGATRDTVNGKLDFEGFLSPLVLYRYAQYLDKHRMQPDGSMRGSDNWQAGMPCNTYMQSGLRHEIDVWSLHRGFHVYHERTSEGNIKSRIFPIALKNVPEFWEKVNIQDAICGVLFNRMGYLFELLREHHEEENEKEASTEMG